MKRRMLIPGLLIVINLAVIFYFIASTERMSNEAIEEYRPHFHDNGVSFKTNSAIGIIIFGHNLSLHWASALERLIILPNTIPYLLVAMLAGFIDMLPLSTMVVTNMTGLIFLLATSVQWLLVGIVLDRLALGVFHRIA